MRFGVAGHQFGGARQGRDGIGQAVLLLEHGAKRFPAEAVLRVTRSQCARLLLRLAIAALAEQSHQSFDLRPSGTAVGFCACAHGANLQRNQSGQCYRRLF